MVSWLEICQLKANILFGCYCQTLKHEICETPMRERRPCEVPAGKEEHVMHQQGKKTLEAPAGKEDITELVFFIVNF